MRSMSDSGAGHAVSKPLLRSSVQILECLDYTSASIGRFSKFPIAGRLLTIVGLVLSARNVSHAGGVKGLLSHVIHANCLFRLRFSVPQCS